MTARPATSRQDAAGVDLGSLREVRPKDYAVRFAFGVTVSAAAALVAIVWGDRLGGLFLAFPAILPATLTLLQKEHGQRSAVSDVHGATLGAAGMVAFAVSVTLLLAYLGGWALVIAIGCWAGVSVTLYALSARFGRRPRSASRDPR
jgi:hypothetical protein